MTKPILGRGLSSLLPQKDSAAAPSPSVSDKTKESVFYVELEHVIPNPHQPRRDFAEASLRELADSIREHGILQPLVVTKHEHPRPRGREVTYEIIAGERRWRAAALAGLRHIPVIIRDTAERQKLELALVENLQRHDLNALEEAGAFRKLTEEFGLSQEDVARQVGKSRSTITNTLRLLGLPQEVQRALAENRISEGHARALLGLKDPVQQLALLKDVLAKQLSVRDVEELVRLAEGRPRGTRQRSSRSAARDPEVRELESKLAEVLGTRVALKGGPARGRIVVEFYSREDLQRLIEKISPGGPA